MQDDLGILQKTAFVCMTYEEMRRAVEFISLDVVEKDIVTTHSKTKENHSNKTI